VALLHIRLKLDRAGIDDVLPLGGGESAIGEQGSSTDDHADPQDALYIHALSPCTRSREKARFFDLNEPQTQGPQRENAEKPSSNPLPFPLRLGGEKNLTANLANDANLLEEE
jgi:hypothetical protein